MREERSRAARVGIGAVHEHRRGRAVDRDAGAVRRREVAQPALGPRRLVVERLGRRVVDPRAGAAPARRRRRRRSALRPRRRPASPPGSAPGGRARRGRRADRRAPISRHDRTMAPAYRSRVRSSSTHAQSTLGGCIATPIRPRSSPRPSSTTRRSDCGWIPCRSTAPKSSSELAGLAGQTITADGMGGAAALKLFGDVLAPACISVDHPRFLSFIPAAPTEASMLFDLVVRRVVHLRRLVARGRRRGLRREPGAAVRRRPGRPARRRRRRLRLGRHPGQPVGARDRPPRRAQPPHRRLPRPLEGGRAPARRTPRSSTRPR